MRCGSNWKPSHAPIFVQRAVRPAWNGATAPDAGRSELKSTAALTSPIPLINGEPTQFLSVDRSDQLPLLDRCLRHRVPLEGRMRQDGCHFHKSLAEPRMRMDLSLRCVASTRPLASEYRVEPAKMKSSRVGSRTRTRIRAPGVNRPGLNPRLLSISRGDKPTRFLSTVK